MEVTRYEPGNPCWVGLSTTDVPSASAFYSELFGWGTQTSPEPETGGYTFCTVRDLPVAGLGPTTDPDQPTAWTVFFSTHSLDTTTATLEIAGGKILVPPTDVMDSGRMAIYMDVGGAVFGAWQPLAFAGARLRDEPGAMCWAELLTRDTTDAEDFYAHLFGWGSHVSHMPEMAPYTEFRLDGESVAGMMAMEGPQWPPDLPPFWMPYFEVEDCDHSAAEAAGLDATVLRAPTSISPGRFAVLSDPQGAPFGIIKMERTE